MGLLEWIVVGLVVGLLARLLLPGRDPIGCLMTVAVGVIGAIIGGRLWAEFFGPQRGVAWIGSIIAAMVLLVVLRPLYRHRL